MRKQVRRPHRHLVVEEPRDVILVRRPEQRASVRGRIVNEEVAVGMARAAAHVPPHLLSQTPPLLGSQVVILGGQRAPDAHVAPQRLRRWNRTRPAQAWYQPPHLAEALSRPRHVLSRQVAEPVRIGHVKQSALSEPVGRLCQALQPPRIGDSEVPQTQRIQAALVAPIEVLAQRPQLPHIQPCRIHPVLQQRFIELAPEFLGRVASKPVPLADVPPEHVAKARSEPPAQRELDVPHLDDQLDPLRRISRRRDRELSHVLARLRLRRHADRDPQRLDLVRRHSKGLKRHQRVRPSPHSLDLVHRRPRGDIAHAADLNLIVPDARILRTAKPGPLHPHVLDAISQRRHHHLRRFALPPRAFQPQLTRDAVLAVLRREFAQRSLGSEGEGGYLLNAQAGEIALELGDASPGREGPRPLMQSQPPRPAYCAGRS